MSLLLDNVIYKRIKTDSASRAFFFFLQKQQRKNASTYYAVYAEAYIGFSLTELIG